MKIYILTYSALNSENRVVLANIDATIRYAIKKGATKENIIKMASAASIALTDYTLSIEALDNDLERFVPCDNEVYENFLAYFKYHLDEYTEDFQKYTEEDVIHVSDNSVNNSNNNSDNNTTNASFGNFCVVGNRSTATYVVNDDSVKIKYKNEKNDKQSSSSAVYYSTGNFCTVGTGCKSTYVINTNQ